MPQEDSRLHVLSTLGRCLGWIQSFRAVGDEDLEADRTVALSYTGARTRMAYREERPQVCDEIRLALAEVRRRTPWRVCAGPPGDEAHAHRPWDHGWRSSSSSSSLPPPLPPPTSPPYIRLASLDAGASPRTPLK